MYRRRQCRLRLGRGLLLGRGVRCKGASAGWAAKKMRDDVNGCGYAGSRVRMKSD